MKVSSVDEFISKITGQLGIGESQGRSATGGILNFIKGQLDEGTFNSMLEKLPGADSLMSESSSGKPGGGGLMGSLTSMAGGLLGGGDSGAAGIAEALGDSGLSLDKVPGFLSALVPFLKEKLGDDLFGTLAKNVPGINADS